MNVWTLKNWSLDTNHPKIAMNAAENTVERSTRNETTLGLSLVKIKRNFLKVRSCRIVEANLGRAVDRILDIGLGELLMRGILRLGLEWGYSFHYLVLGSSCDSSFLA